MYLPNKSYNNTQSGQALIIILLAMSVALTLVLSSVTRSVTDVRITDQEEESLRAFSAAEAGVEQALLTLTTTGSFDSIGGNFSGQSSSSYEAEAITGPVGTYYEFPKDLGPGETATFWLVGHDANGDLTCSEGGGCSSPTHITVCFGNSESPVNAPGSPATEIMAYYDSTATSPTNEPDSVSSNNYSSVKVDIKTLDSNGPRTASNGFQTAVTCPITELNTEYSWGSTFAQDSIGDCTSDRPCVLMLKVKSLYATNTPVAIGLNGGTNSTIPAQGIVISSTGTAGTDNKSTRKLNVEYNYSSIPAVFDNTVFSGGDLVQN